MQSIESKKISTKELDYLSKAIDAEIPNQLTHILNTFNVAKPANSSYQEKGKNSMLITFLVFPKILIMTLSRILISTLVECLMNFFQLEV